MLKVQTKKVIEVQDWDKLVEETYKRPYSFQQQDDCKPRGVFHLKIPISKPTDFENDSVPEVVNGNEMGVSFKAWLERDPKKPIIENGKTLPEYCTNLFWERNFYPDIEIVANDLHSKGLLEAGEYMINIDW